MAERNIALAFPEMDEVQQDGLVRETLQETGSLAAEMGHVWLRPWSRTAALINRVEGEGFGEGRSVPRSWGHCSWSASR